MIIKVKMYLRTKKPQMTKRFPFLKGKTFQLYYIGNVMQCAVRQPGEEPGQAFQIELRDLQYCTRAKFKAGPKH